MYILYYTLQIHTDREQPKLELEPDGMPCLEVGISCSGDGMPCSGNGMPCSRSGMPCSRKGKLRARTTKKRRSRREYFKRLMQVTAEYRKFDMEMKQYWRISFDTILTGFLTSKFGLFRLSSAGASCISACNG